MADFLEQNEVFYAHDQMFVHVKNYPVSLYKNQSIYSEELTDGLTRVNELRENRTNASIERSKVALAIEAIFKKELIPLDLEILRRFINHQIKDPKPRKIFIPEGYYIVTRLEIGENGRDRRLFCKTYKSSISNPEVEFYFYQNSCLTANCNRIMAVDVSTITF